MIQFQLIQSHLGILQFLYQIFGFEFSYFFNLHSLSVFIEITSYNKLSLHWQFLCTKTKCLLCDVETHTLYFKEDTTRRYRSNPSCGITFTLTHSDIGRLTSNRFVREDANPNLPLAVHVAIHSNTGSFNLTAVNPFCFKGLDAE